MAQKNASPQSAAASSLPDVNAQIYPYDLVQSMLDQTANFSMFSVPSRHHAENATINPQNPGDWFGLDGGYGFDLLGDLRHFESAVEVRGGAHVKVSASVGE
jgi:hypothetical protein